MGVSLFDDFSVIERFIDINAIHLANPDAAEAYCSSKALFEDCYYALEGVFRKME